MADYDVYVQVAETTVKTYRVRVSRSSGRLDAETQATAALRREPLTNDQRFEITSVRPATSQILTASVVDLSAAHG